MHFEYRQKLNHPEDFRVKYRFYSEEEGGRKTLPFQGYRSDFWYNRLGNQSVSQLFMIWPEFEDENGKVIIENDHEVPAQGTAKMWILDPSMRDFHRETISVGLEGFFMEGPRRVAECEVIEIVGLMDNPRA